MAERFEIDITRFADKAMKRARTVVHKICLDLDRNLVLGTPVDTGRARGGWNVGINSPNLQETLNDPGGQITMRDNKKIIEMAQLGDRIFLSNNVAYIGYLDEGSSQQAPLGIVDVQLRRFPAITRKAVIDSKRQHP